ncbi:MAG: acyl carrier protein [Pseudonocardiales bacterium]|nr:acyl carrier protein [Pseudonocardiales bacterium]
MSDTQDIDAVRSSSFDGVLAGVREIVAEVSDGPPTDETLRSLDSIALVELVVRLEEHFGLEIPDTSLNDAVFDSTDNLCVLLTKEMSKTD